MKNKAVTAKQIQALDRKAIEKYGVPSIVLMENAGKAVAEEVLKEKPKQVCVFCGTGNNGGDGLVVARHLLKAGVKSKTFLIGRADELKTDALTNYQMLKNRRYAVTGISSLTGPAQKAVLKSDIIVDAIFGVGLNRKIGQPHRRIIQFLNKSKKRILAVDVPSGLDATTGKIHGVCVKAYKTVTFSFPKTGFFRQEGPSYIGKMVVAGIGIPSDERK